MEREPERRRPHQIILEERRRLLISGVEQVDCYDEQQVVLQTSLGRLEVRGEGMLLESLSTDGGDLVIEGKIGALFYTDRQEERLWKRLGRKKG